MKTIYHKHPTTFFVGKKAVMICDVYNCGGECIFKGEIVTIRWEYKGFSVLSDSGVMIWRVDSADLELLEKETK